MSLHDRLEQVFQNVFNDDELTLRDDLTAADIAGWDSVAHINLMFAIEETFGIQFAGNELAEFKTIGDLERFLQSKTSAAA